MLGLTIYWFGLALEYLKGEAQILCKRLNYWRTGYKAREEANDESSVVCGWFTLHWIVSWIDVGLI